MNLQTNDNNIFKDTEIEKVSGLTEAEQEISHLLAKAWNLYLVIMQEDEYNRHKDDHQLFRLSIRNCQTVLGQRIVRREYPQYWI